MGIRRVAHAYERAGTPIAGATVRAAQNARSGVLAERARIVQSERVRFRPLAFRTVGGRASMTDGFKATGDLRLCRRGNRVRHSGSALGQSGRAKDKLEEVVDKAEGKVEELVDKAKDALHRK